MENLYLTLPSNTTDFPSNTTAEFRVRLPNPLELDGEWEMALVEIQYPYSWNNLNGGDSPRMGGNWILINMHRKNKYFQGMIDIGVPPGAYANIEELLDAIEQAIQDWKTPEGVSFLHRQVKLSYNKLRKRVTLKVDNRAIKGVILGTTLQYMLGFGGSQLLVFSAATNIAKYPPDITSGLHALFVYCNLVQPQIVGNALAPLLRTTPVEGVYGQSIDKVFLDPHYIPLRNKSFDTVEIAIKDDTDTPVGFQFGKTIIKLHLRRKQ